MCSVVTNLVTSLELQPIRSVTTLFHFGRTRNVYVATRIILLSSSAESSDTSGYVVASERSGKVRHERVETLNGLGKSLVCSQQWIFSMQHVSMNLLTFHIDFILCILIFFPMYLLISSDGKFLLSCVYVFVYCVGGGITTLISISDGSDPYFSVQ